jgi:hypothetical protein
MQRAITLIMHALLCIFQLLQRLWKQFQNSYTYNNVYESIVYNNYDRYTLSKSLIIQVTVFSCVPHTTAWTSRSNREKGSKAMKNMHCQSISEIL